MEKLTKPSLVTAKPVLQAKIPSVDDIMGRTTVSRNMPEKKFRSGAIAATIWANSTVKEGKAVTYRTISLQRSYKDKDDKWQNTDSLRSSDLPRAILVLQKAYEYVALNVEEAEEENIY